MATEVSGRWNNLPSIIVVEILSFLTLRERLLASSICKSWRDCLFHPTLWRKVLFSLNSCDNKKPKNEWAKFLARHCGRFVHEVVIEINSWNSVDVQTCKEILQVLALNYNLRALSLRTCNLRFDWLDDSAIRTLGQCAHILIEVARQARSLEHLTLGCLFIGRGDKLLQALAHHQAASMRSIHMASLSPAIRALGIKSYMFEPFRHLEVLCLDYNHMDDQLLHLLSREHCPPLARLQLNVHATQGHNISPASWRRIAAHSPHLQVTVTLLRFHMGSSRGVARIFCEYMPLVHFRFYFCSEFNVDILNRIALLNNGTLRSLTLVDGPEEGRTTFSFLPFALDPLVMLAWKCHKLDSLTVIGYEVSGDNLIAISRLRGQNLKEFCIPSRCISTAQLEEALALGHQEAQRHLVLEVSRALQRGWSPAHHLPPLTDHLLTDHHLC